MRKTLYFLFSLLIPFGHLIFLSVLLGTATITANIGLMGTSAYLIARAAQHPSIAYLEVAIVGVRFFGLARGIFRYLERLVSHSLNFKLLTQLRIRIYQKLEPLAPGGLLLQRGGDLLDRMVENVEALEDFYIRTVSPPFVALIVMGGLSLFLGQINASLGLILLTGMLINAAAFPLLTYFSSRFIGHKIVQTKTELSALMIENFQGLDDLVLNGQAAHYLSDIDRISARLGNLQIFLAAGNGLTGGLNILAANLTLWMMLLVIVPLVTSGRLNGVMVAVISLVTLAGFEAVSPLAQAAQNLEKSLASGQRIRELDDFPILVVDPLKPVSDDSAQLIVEFSKVGFKYSEKENWELHDIQFKINPGDKIALVGTNGAGKTTLAHLLQKFYTPTTGEIFLNGININGLTQEDVRRRIALVSQTTYLFNDTLKNNLLLANLQASDNELMRMISSVGLSGWLSTLPSGLNTWLGEGGTFMSGGERQRIALARAALQNANLVIFDEPTANLDQINSRQIMNSLLDPIKGHSILWITHNFMGLEKMDEIIVMDQGRIIERGTHTRLMESKGLYAGMWKTQNGLI